MSGKHRRGFIETLVQELGEHLLKFVLFMAVPTGAGVLVGVFSPASVLLCAALGAALGFIAWWIVNLGWIGMGE